MENDAQIKNKLIELPPLPKEPTPQQVAQVIQEFDYLLTKLSPGAIAD